MARPDLRGHLNGRAKLTADDVIEIRSRKLYHGILLDLAEEFRVSTAAIGKIRSRTTWSHIPEHASECTVLTDKARESLRGARTKRFRKLSEEALEEILACPKGYGSTIALAKKFGVSVTTISRIRRRVAHVR